MTLSFRLSLRKKSFLFIKSIIRKKNLFLLRKSVSKKVVDCFLFSRKSRFLRKKVIFHAKKSFFSTKMALFSQEKSRLLFHMGYGVDFQQKCNHRHQLRRFFSQKSFLFAKKVVSFLRKVDSFRKKSFLFTKKSFLFAKNHFFSRSLFNRSRTSYQTYTRPGLQVYIKPMSALLKRRIVGQSITSPSIRYVLI